MPLGIRDLQPDSPSPPFVSAALTSAAVVSFDMGGRATRDALFLSAFGPSRLPAMVFLGSALALLVGVVAGRLMAHTPNPARLLARALLGSALLLLLEWALSGRYGPAVAVLVYLHFTGASGLFISGFWTVVSEQFDPGTARRSIARIAAAGTMGGLLGGLFTGWVGSAFSTATMLPLLAVLNVAAALTLGGLSSPREAEPEPADAEPLGLGVLGVGLPRYVQILLAVVVLGAVNETVLDFLFMARASASAQTSEQLLRMFAGFYTAAAVLTVLAQLLITRRTMERIGLPATAASLPAGVLAGAAAGLVWPGLTSAAVARGVEIVLRNSTFRAAYELLFNPMPSRQKRATKTVVDVTAQRFGRIAGSGVVQVTLLLAPVYQYAVLAAIVLALAIVALAVFRWVAQHHQRALERSLVRRASRAVEAVGHDLLDTTTFPIFTDAHAIETAASLLSAEHAGAESARREELASNDVTRVIRALEDGPLLPSLIPDVVPLLAWDEVAAPCIRALRSIAADAMPQLVQWLADPETPARVRRRLVVVLGACATPEARDGLLGALRDSRFEVRYRSSRSLARLMRLDPALTPTREQMLPIIGAELDQGQTLVQGRRAVELLPEEEEDRGLLGEVLRERRDQVLEHLFTMLGFCFPGEPLTVALRGVRSRDEHLRATAFEYLESTLPGDLRRRLWPILDAPPIRRPSSAAPPREAIDSLLSARHSIAFRVDELRAQLEDLERRQPGDADRPE
jgi:ATP:ADP antiporter, AAA family